MWSRAFKQSIVHSQLYEADLQHTKTGPNIFIIFTPKKALVKYTLPQKKHNFSGSSIPVAHGSGSVTQGQSRHWPWPRGFRIK